ncbi:hypothetical protein Patl1_03853 [Pistacia atlantica]|uniref:Uncharacterized protein n=1 Tax=Pistacia atlantica TaxID=434234 RepID=A0ACC1BSD1_9ROSI|nr:hypothetical protein Patl1_03853 [Pistacia atlantica]
MFRPREIMSGEKLDGDNRLGILFVLWSSICSRKPWRMERNMQELLLKKKEDDVALVNSPSSCVMSQNFDHDNFLLPLKEMYTDLMNEKAKIGSAGNVYRSDK